MKHLALILCMSTSVNKLPEVCKKTYVPTSCIEKDSRKEAHKAAKGDKSLKSVGRFVCSVDKEPRNV